MNNYICPRCGYSTNIKTILIRHYNRKNICKNVISNDNLQSEYFKYKIKTKSEIPKYSKNGFANPNYSKNGIVNKCTFCNKEFSTKGNLNKHEKVCKEKKIDEDFKNNMLELINKLNEQQIEFKIELDKKEKEHRIEIEEKNKQINDLIKKVGIQNSNITTNVQNNIKILAYKNTDLSHLTDQDYIFCLNRSNMCIPHLIKKIHFNPKKPENHNIYISNIKNKYIMLYDGDKWVLQNQIDTLNELIDKNEYVLEQKLEEWIENGKDYPEIMKKFNRYLEKKDDDIVINKIKEEIQLMLYNNSKLVNKEI